MIKLEDKTRKVELLESEIDTIINCIQQEPHVLFVMCNCQKIIDKLKKSIK